MIDTLRCFWFFQSLIVFNQLFIRFLWRGLIFLFVRARGIIRVFLDHKVNFLHCFLWFYDFLSFIWKLLLLVALSVQWPNFTIFVYRTLALLWVLTHRFLLVPLRWCSSHALALTFLIAYYLLLFNCLTQITMFSRLIGYFLLFLCNPCISPVSP